MIFLKKKISFELIGEGLNAEVYKFTEGAPEYGLSETFALKVLKRNDDLDHFKKEYHNLSKASGKRLVKFRGWKKYKSRPGLILEYIDGATLKELLCVHTLSKEESLWIYSEIKRGLYELNESGLFHGDLSPNNIMITKNGDVKLIDFGLALWRTKKIEVTPQFASPSVLKGFSPDLNSDLHSLEKIASLLKHTTDETPASPKTSPESLKIKILGLDVRNQSTASLESEFPSEDSKVKSGVVLKKRFFQFLAGLVFVTPVNALNRVPSLTSVKLRSLDWMEVSHNQKDWCYTPCSLNFKSLGLQKVYWKSKKNAGISTVFLSKNNQTLLISNSSSKN